MFLHLLYRECLENALEIYKKRCGPEHPSVAQVLLNLGLLWKTAGNKSEATSFCRKALHIQKKIYGPNHLKVSHHSVIWILPEVPNF